MLETGLLLDYQIIKALVFWKNSDSSLNKKYWVSDSKAILEQVSQVIKVELRQSSHKAVFYPETPTHMLSVYYW